MPNVEIHAHILNNLLDGTSIKFTPAWLRWLLAVLLALSGFFLFARYGFLPAASIWLLTLLMLSGVAFMLFAAMNLWLAPAALYFTITSAFLLAYIFKLQNMQQLLAQAQADWEGSFDTINDAITIHDQDCNIIQVNSAAHKLLDAHLMELLTQRCLLICHGEANGPASESACTQTEALIEEVFDPALNRYTEIKSHARLGADGRALGVVQVVRDVSDSRKSEKEHRRLHSQLIQAQKMEAIGTLAGGIAHDFNNILAAIMGYTELSLQEAPENSSLKSKLEQVLKAGMRAKELVEQILAFGRQTQQVLQPQPIQIGLIVKEVLKFLKSTFPSTIQIRQNLLSRGSVMMDPSQMHQIVMNLCTNAKHAMEENGGTLEVELRELEIESDAESGPDAAGLQPGPYLKLTVRDSGPGIAPDAIKRIFEPYFTTKEKGVGTGLGLAMVHGIATRCHGTVTVDTRLGKGTAFHVFLPRSDSGEQNQRAGSMLPLPAGPERILLVDDEPQLIAVGHQMLEMLGYQVVTRNSSLEALKAFKQSPHDYDLVITDMTMPYMTGEKLARELIAIRPEIPVILCTGYSDRINEQTARAIGVRAFAMKPFTLSHLARTIREVLDDR